MIGIFHNLPNLKELKRNYLFFDEIQTSEQYLKTILALIRQEGASNSVLAQINDFEQNLYYLFENDLLKSKEDIESRLLPIIGDFDRNSISRYLRMHGSSLQNLPLTEFFNNIAYIHERFGVEIIAEQRGIFGASSRGADFLRNNLEQMNNGNVLSFVNEFSGMYSRFAALVLNRQFNDNNYMPLLDVASSLSLSKRFIDYKSDHFYDSYDHQGYDSSRHAMKPKIINLVMNKMPFPDETVGWEKLFDFKNDPDSRRKILALRNWINEVSSTSMTLSEIEEKFEYLLMEYTLHLEMSKIKFTHGIFESLILPTLEVFENLVKINFGKALKVGLEFRKSKFELFEAESQFPGRELAYIQKVQTFK